MKFTLIASLATVAVAQIDLDDASLDMKTRFAAFTETFDKTYTVDEEEAAFAAFAVNDANIQDVNDQGLTYTLGHNVFSDLMPDDWYSMYVTGYNADPNAVKNYDLTLGDTDRVAAAPTAKDWTTLGAVTPIKNQGQCGSCWAFSTVMGIEGDLFVEQQKLISLSEEQLVSCDHNGDQGCNGGLMDNAFTWVAEKNPLCTEADYPYTSGTGTTGTCKTTCTGNVEITGHTDVTPKDEAALLTAANQQPISVAIEADKSVFQSYKSGVLTSKTCGTQLDHGVGIVGFGTEAGTKYWKVKNSWGTTWGMDGYILMERDVNMCGISQSASFPTGATSGGPAPPGPAPTPGPAPPTGKTHYGDPISGTCESDEVNITITGVTGSVCSPECTGVFKTKCPTDLPAACTAEPECALQDSGTKKKYCALICSTDLIITEDENDMCGKATCKQVPSAGVGVCTYDD